MRLRPSKAMSQAPSRVKERTDTPSPYGEFAKQYERNRNAYLQQDAALRVQAQHEAMQQQVASQPDDPSIPEKLFQSLQMPQSSPSTNCTTQYRGDQAFSKCS